jgi:hypothetical protein
MLFARMELTTVANRATLSLSVATNARKFAMSQANALNHARHFWSMAVDHGAIKYAQSANTGVRLPATQARIVPLYLVRPRCATTANVVIVGFKSSANPSLIEFPSSVTLVAGKSRETRKSPMFSAVSLPTSKTKTRSSLITIRKRHFSSLRRICFGARRSSLI